MKHNQATQDNTRALGELADAIRPIDGNGHVPDEPEGAGRCCGECCTCREIAAYQRGRQEATLDMIAAIAAQAQANLERVLEQLTGRREQHDA